LNTIPDANTMQPAAFWLWGGITPPYQYQTRAFLWDKEKGMRDLGTLPGGTDAQAFLINEHGQVIGVSYTSSAPGACGGGFALTTGAFIWDRKHRMRDLGSFGGTCTIAQDLNERGQVVGFSLNKYGFEKAFLWDGSIHNLGGSIGGKQEGAFAINEQGQAVGFGTLAGETSFHAALWRQIGKITDLGVVGNDQCSFAATINARGQVVGSSYSICNSDSAITRAFLWEHGSIFDLNTLVPHDSAVYLEDIFTINDRGEMAGEGVDTHGNAHAFMLIPCDENHPGVAGCDYSLVDAVAAAQSPAPSYVPSGAQHPLQSRRTNRYHIPGLQASNK
jgi:probable HAF family extracellular repeat protein